MNPIDPAARIVALSRELGFDLCGIAPAAEFPELAHLSDWLERGHAGEMRYLHDERRRSPALAMPGARSVIVCALNYNTGFPSSTEATAPTSSQNAQLAGFPATPGAMTTIRFCLKNSKR